MLSLLYEFRPFNSSNFFVIYESSVSHFEMSSWASLLLLSVSVFPGDFTSTLCSVTGGFTSTSCTVTSTSCSVTVLSDWISLNYVEFFYFAWVYFREHTCGTVLVLECGWTTSRSL